MRLGIAIGCLAAVCAAEVNLTNPQISRQILPRNFKPPQVFKNVDLVRNINLEKCYPREKIDVVIQNIDSSPQDEYFVPFEAAVLGRVGSLQVRDKQDVGKGLFDVEMVDYDPYSPTQFYRVKLPEPLQPKIKQTLSISFSILSAFKPLPSTIEQTDKQYLHYTFSAYASSAYTTTTQRTNLKLPSTNIPDYDVLVGINVDKSQDPQRQGSTFTYGAYSDVPAGASEMVSLRYEFTKPLTHATLLERDIEVSHWGGNVAIEERYWLVNRAASLKTQFSRVAWQNSAYSNPPTSALKGLKIPLALGTIKPYYVDDIGNVSTSRFLQTKRGATLELKPRYPVFGSWKYKFKVGWDRDLRTVMRKLQNGDGYVLRVPFLEGPKQSEGIEYEKVVVRVVLPEGAINVRMETDVVLASSEISLHRTFMDTVGRTTLKLTAFNVVDELRDYDLIVIYDYPFSAGFRKPFTIVTGVFCIFVAAWALGRVDTSIRKRA